MNEETREYLIDLVLSDLDKMTSDFEEYIDGFNPQECINLTINTLLELGLTEQEIQDEVKSYLSKNQIRVLSVYSYLF